MCLCVPQLALVALRVQCEPLNFRWPQKCECILKLLLLVDQRVKLVVTFSFLLQTFSIRWGPTNGTSMQYEYRLSDGGYHEVVGTHKNNLIVCLNLCIHRWHGYKNFPSHPGTSTHHLVEFLLPNATVKTNMNAKNSK